MRDGKGQPSSPVDDHDQGLRERLRVYETFDEVISESMRRARGFLEEAAELRERVTRELAEARRELEEEIAEARADLREEIAEARAEIEEERNQLVSIAQSILNRSNSGGAGASRNAATAAAASAEPKPVSPLPFEQQPAHEAEQDAALIPAPVTSETPAAADIEPAAPATLSEPAQSASPSPAADADETVRTTIIVHGIHKPAIATGLQRYLLAQPGVTSVEPREFAEGILRLQVHATTSVDDALFSGWSDGAGMTVIQRVPRTVEVILPSAT